VEWTVREIRLPVGPLSEQRCFLLAHWVRVGAELSGGKRRCRLDASRRHNGEQQEWNSGVHLRSHIGGQDSHAEHDQQHDHNYAGNDNNFYDDVHNYAHDNDNDDADDNDSTDDNDDTDDDDLDEREWTVVQPDKPLEHSYSC
jgi:hypothetical protein